MLVKSLENREKKSTREANYRLTRNSKDPYYLLQDFDCRCSQVVTLIVSFYLRTLYTLNQGSFCMTSVFSRRI